MANLYATKPTPSIELPGTATSPFGLSTINAPGSNYASNYSYNTTKLIADEILSRIVDTAPEQFNALKILFSTAPELVSSDELIWFEMPWSRPIIEVFAWNNGTGVITLAGTYNTSEELPAVKGDVITAPDGTPLLVVSNTLSAGVANGSSLTVIPQQGGAMGAGLLSNGDYCPIQAPIIADGMNDFLHYDRVNPDEKYNYVQRFQRNDRWGSWELQKMLKKGVTDFVEYNKREKIRQLRTDMFSVLFTGVRGEYRIPAPVSGNYLAKSTMGIYPFMTNAGSLHATVSLSGLTTAFEYLALASNYKAEGAVRFIYGTDAMLNELSKAYKDSKTRYTPDSKMANLNLSEITLGSSRYVLVNCELFRDKATFAESWANRLLVIDQEAIKPFIFSAFPMMDSGQTNNKQNGSREDFTDWWIHAQFGLKFTNPLGSFYIDVS